MSATKTREILERAKRHGWAGAEAALDELADIEKAAGVVVRDTICICAARTDEQAQAIGVLERIAREHALRASECPATRTRSPCPRGPAARGSAP